MFRFKVWQIIALFLFLILYLVAITLHQHVISIRCSSPSKVSSSKSSNGNFEEALKHIQKAIEGLKADDTTEAETRLKRTLAELSR
jgi:hypothetical protein